MTYRLISLTLISSILTSGLTPVWAASNATPAASPAPAVAPAPPVEEADSGESEPVTPETPLAPGFLIDLKCPQDPGLSGTFRIQFDHRLDLPYSMTADTRGMTLKQLRAEVFRLYRPYFKGRGAVAVTIKQRKYWIDVRGLVTKPGTLLVKKDTALDEIIALAGGLSDKLAAGFVRVEQTDGTAHWLDLNDYFKNGKNDLPPWRGADRIFFQKEGPDADNASSGKAAGESLRKVQILGEVKNPGEVTYRPGADGYHYLIKTGGPTTQADLDVVELVRADAKTGERKPISVGPVYDMKTITEGDIMIVRSQRPSQGERTLQTAAIVTSMLTAISLAAYIIIHGNKQ